METTELLKKVRKIEIKTKGLSQQVFSGQYHSAFKGRGMAFSEVREYNYGDDVRSIDWNVTARYHKPYIKIFEEERELTVVLLIDVSASTLFGTSKFKQEFITEIAATLAFSAIQNNDKVGVIFFSDHVERYISPKKGRSHILRIIRELLTIEPVNKATNLDVALQFLNNVIKKRCTAFVLSDFMNTDFKNALKIVKKKHDLMTLRIYDKRETDIPDMGLVHLKDVETGKMMLIDTALKSNREALKYNWQKHTDEVDTIFKKFAITSGKVATNEDFVKPLLKLFQSK